MRYADAGDSGAPEFALVIAEGEGAGERFDFDRVEITVGRNPENDLVLSHTKISRTHFAIRYAGKKYLIRDEGSSNGTLVNGRRIKKSLLSDGDEIAAGPFRLVFSIGEATVRTQSPAASAGDDRTPTGERPLPPGGTGLVRGARPLARAGERSGRKATPQRIKPIRRRQPLGGQLELWLGRLQNVVQPVRHWLQAQDQLTRILVYTLSGGIGLLVILLLIVLAVSSGGAAENLSAVPVDAPAAGPFGFSADDRSHPDELRVSFPYRDGRATLEFDAYNVTANGEVVITVNGIKVGDVPLCPEKWTEGVRLTLPKKHLLERTANVVVFDHLKNPPERREWGVAAIKLFEEPLPRGDLGKAREYLERARKRYQNRRIGYENLYRAWEYFRLARDYLEELEPKPAIYEEANAMVDTCRRELEAEFSGGMFRIHRALEYDNLKEAQQEANRLLRFFPEPEDRRYREVKQLLEQFGE